ncbi:MAG: transposase [Solobacterium sp.]|nr:transposase [Solobacterium sp.]
MIASFSLVKGKRVSNGPIEGRNSLIKKILRLANGYTNFQRFRNRIMYSLNKLATHSFKRK